MYYFGTTIVLKLPRLAVFFNSERSQFQKVYYCNAREASELHLVGARPKEPNKPMGVFESHRREANLKEP